MSPFLAPVSEAQVANLIDNLSHLPVYSIGRKAGNSVVLPHEKISGQHARLIQCTLTCFVLEDLDSKHGTFVNGIRVTRKIIDNQDILRIADTETSVEQLLKQVTSSNEIKQRTTESVSALADKPVLNSAKTALEFTEEFAALQQVFEQYPKLKRDCRNREKMIRTGSVILSSIVGVSAVLTSGGAAAIPLLHILSGAGLSMLVPTLCSTLLSTDEKLELIDKEYRERYRCPNQLCRDPFGTREWELLAKQKTCRRCQAIWIR